MRHFTDVDIATILENLTNPKTESDQTLRLQDQYSKLDPQDKAALISKFKTLWPLFHHRFQSKTLMFFLNLTEEQSIHDFSLEIAKECLKKKDLNDEDSSAVYDALSSALSRGLYNGSIGIDTARDLASYYCWLAFLKALCCNDIGRQKRINGILQGFEFLSVNSSKARGYLSQIYRLGLGVERNPDLAVELCQVEDQKTNGHAEHVEREKEIILNPDAILKIGEPAPLIDLSKPLPVVHGSPISIGAPAPLKPAAQPAPATGSQPDTTPAGVVPRFVP